MESKGIISKQILKQCTGYALTIILIMTKEGEGGKHESSCDLWIFYCTTSDLPDLTVLSEGQPEIT